MNNKNIDKKNQIQFLSSRSLDRSWSLSLISDWVEEVQTWFEIPT